MAKKSSSQPASNSVAAGQDSETHTRVLLTDEGHDQINITGAALAMILHELPVGSRVPNAHEMRIAYEKHDLDKRAIGGAWADVSITVPLDRLGVRTIYQG